MEPWVHDLARTLVTETTAQMAGIRLGHTTQFPWNDLPQQHVVVYGLIQGDYEIHVQLLTEWKMLYRLTRNMLEADPEDDDVREYALEYFNTICGRFVSEIINRTHLKERLHPVGYEMSSASPILSPGEQVSTIYFISDHQEQLIFSWTSMPITNMMRSNENE